jgi:hypothetical protein
MDINGIPLHPLVVHAAVVFVPLSALAVILMSVPKWRWLARWPAAVLTVGAALSVQVATLTGEDLEESRNLESALIEDHAEWGERLQIAMWVLAAVTVLALWALPHVTRLAGGQDRAARVAALEKPLVLLLPVLAVVVLVLVVLTGDAGARSVWSGS